ncbi:nitroreductase family protein [Methanobacterium sp.]|uniref:nitroreductase family protein n=1 Tax=Methanobacterium sp. TaxID=2164 RepID=UPI003C70C2F3
MEFLELIEKRYSVRAYNPENIEDEKLNTVLEAARLAPTAVNYQPFQIIVIHTKDREMELNRIYPAEWFVQPPIILCICAVRDKAWTRRDGKNFMDIDAAIVMDHIILAATSVGLGTCWIGAFDAKSAKEILNLPEGVEPILFTPLGYPADEPGTKRRKELSELVRYEQW